MRKMLLRATVLTLAVVAGFLLAVCLPGRPADPLAGFERREIESTGIWAVVDYWRPTDLVDDERRYVDGPNGLQPLDLGALSSYIREKHRYAPASQQGAIRDFIRLHNRLETVVVRSAADIPGFSRDQLEPDLRGIIIAASDTESGPDSVSVVYAWSKLGGTLMRYRFVSPSGQTPYCDSYAVLGTMIGDAQLIEVQ